MDEQVGFTDAPAIRKISEGCEKRVFQHNTAIPNYGSLMKWLSVQTPWISATNIFEQSLSTHDDSSISRSSGQRPRQVMRALF